MTQGRIRILMTSPSYPEGIDDWRSVFIRQMVTALAARTEVELSLWAPEGPVPERVRLAATTKEKQWLQDLSRQGGIASALRRNPILGAWTGLTLARHLHRAYKRYNSVDLIHANWLQLAIPLPRDSKQPLLVTALGTDLSLLKLPGMVSLLRNRFASRRTALCPNSEWMESQLRRHFGDVAIVRSVPFGIDSSYYSLDRRPRPGPHKWICVSRVTPGKIGHLFDWGAEAFKSPERELHLIGPMQGKVDIPAWVKYHGAASQRELITRWFPEATGLISLSTHPEGRPQVMLEALASGIPIIASDLPAHRDVLSEPASGAICRSRAQLPGLLSYLESWQSSEERREATKSYAARCFGTWEDSAARYLEIYRELINQ